MLLVRLEYCDPDDSDDEDINVVVKRVPTLVDESLILDFYCALVANAASYGHTLKDVEDRFDKLGFIVKIIESTNHFEVTVHNSILIKLDREYLEESLIIQRGNLFDAFMAAILAKLIWHDKDVVKLKGYYE